MLTVGIQGGIASFHSVVAKKYFKQTINVVEYDSFDDLAKALSNDKIDLALMGIENKIVGVLPENYKLIIDNNFQIIGESVINIRLYLMALNDSEIKDLQEIQSHPVALKQCQKFLKQYPKIKVVETDDTANAAKYIYESRDETRGAIANLTAAKLYGLNILTRNIAEHIQNNTRFYVLSKSSVETKLVDKVIVHSKAKFEKTAKNGYELIQSIKVDKDNYIAELLVDENDFHEQLDEIKKDKNLEVIGAFKTEGIIHEED